MRRRSTADAGAPITSSRSVDTRINHKLIAAARCGPATHQQQSKSHLQSAAECSEARVTMADLAAWNDSDDDEPRRKKPHVDESALEREVFGNDSDDEDKSADEDAPAWQDDDDEDIRVDLRSASRLKKLRQAPTDRVLKGAALEERLRARLRPRRARRIGPLHRSRTPWPKRPRTTRATTTTAI